MITTETLQRLEFDKILYEIARHAHSDVTSERLLAIAPYKKLEEIQIKNQQIQELCGLQGLGISLRIGIFDDIRPLLHRLRPAGSLLTPQELLVFIPTLENFRDIAKQLLPRSDLPSIMAIVPQISPFSDLLEPIAASIDCDGTIMDSASTALKEIRRGKRSLSARIRKKIEEIIRANDIEIFLQDDFITQRGGRWVIPVRMDSKGMVKGVVHDVSSSGETAFMEPLEIIPFVNELENLIAEEKSEEIRILRQLSAWLRDDAEALIACFETLTTMDYLNSIANFANEYGLEIGKVSENAPLHLVDARHPLLLMLQHHGSKKPVEPLCLSLGDEGCVMVITGPNAGGKTIALKTAGILTLMALSGLPVSANGAQSSFPFLDTLLVDMGDEQSIEQSLSTFSAHIARVATILEQTGKCSLVLLDELGAGTEPHQGSAIACSVLHELQNKGAKVIATTHLSEIIGFVHRTQGMINAGMEYDAKTYTPLYRLISGEPGHSHALDIAVRFGMPENVITFARELLGSAGEEFTSLLAELHRKREELAEGAREIARQKDQIVAARREVDAKAASIEIARREAREKGWQEAKELIAANRRQMNELMEEYKREHRGETLEKLRSHQAELTVALKPELQQDELIPLTSVKAGDSVFIRSLGHSGSILNVLEKQGKARVRSGRMELDVLLSDLCAQPTSQAKKKSERQQASRSWKLETEESEANELKLIGMRVDEALDLLEPFLNHASLAGLREIRVIHGLGTGRLRDAVREFLARHPLVDSYRAGEAHEGRDGATVVRLRG